MPKMKQSELNALVAAHREKFVKSLSTATVNTAVRKSVTGPVVTDIKEHVSISKFLRGGLLGNWDNADEERKIMKALGMNDGTRGGFLIPPILSAEIIELLREKPVIRQLPGVRVIQMQTDKMTFNAGSAAPAISWGGENAQITEDTTMAFAQRVLEIKKAVCLYKMSRELLENANTSVDAYVREELAAYMALEEDRVMLEGTGGTQPLGIYYEPRTLSTTLSRTPVTDDFSNAMYQARIAYVTLNGWVANPRTAYSLALEKDAEGRYIYGPGLGMVKQVCGLPMETSTQVAVVNKPSTSDSYSIGADWSQLVIGEKAGIRIETTDTGGNAFEYDQIFMKLVRFVGKMLRQPQAFVVIKGVQS